jgi:hypothetical protein
MPFICIVIPAAPPEMFTAVGTSAPAICRKQFPKLSDGEGGDDVPHEPEIKFLSYYRFGFVASSATVVVAPIKYGNRTFPVPLCAPQFLETLCKVEAAHLFSQFHTIFTLMRAPASRKAHT